MSSLLINWRDAVCVAAVLWCSLLPSLGFSAEVAPETLPSSVTIEGTSLDSQEPNATTIIVQPVEQPSLEGFGLAAAVNDTATKDPWKNTEKSSLEALLPALTSIPDDSLRTRIVALLQAEATPPSGRGDDWFITRVNALMVLGELDKAKTLLDSVPMSLRTPALVRIRAELALWSNDTDAACVFIEEEIDSDHLSDKDALFWQKLTILCKTLAGKNEEALLGLELLKEERGQDDGFFQSGIRKIIMPKSSLASAPKQWSLLDIIAWRHVAEADDIDKKLSLLPVMALRMLARDEKLSLALREKATTLLRGYDAPQQRSSPAVTVSRGIREEVRQLQESVRRGKAFGPEEQALLLQIAAHAESSDTDKRCIVRLLSVAPLFGATLYVGDIHTKFSKGMEFKGYLPSALLLDQLRDAAVSNRKGETLLLSALVLKQTSPPHDLALIPVIRALKAAGFNTEAQQLSVSALEQSCGRN